MIRNLINQIAKLISAIRWDDREGIVDSQTRYIDHSWLLKALRKTKGEKKNEHRT